MMRRLSALGIVGLLLGSLLSVGAAQAQGEDSLLDLPRLGFEVAPTSGGAGDVVEGQVTVSDIEEHCLELGVAPPPLGPAEPPGSGFAGEIVSNWFAAMDEWLPLPPPEGVDPTDYGLFTITAAVAAFGLGPEEIVELWSAGHVISFVDPVSQELLGDMGSFDPTSGSGTVVVPDLAPGLYAVIAACTQFQSVEELVETGITNGLFAFVEYLDEFYPDRVIPTIGNFQNPDPEFVEYVVGAAEAFFAEMLEPMALGLDFYCIVNDEGFCATPPDPIGLLEELSDEAMAELGDPQAADDPGIGPAPETEPVAHAVMAVPSFTG